MERRLAAILAADIAGYSRIIGADEAGALAAFRAFHTEVFAPAIAGHHGRNVKSMHAVSGSRSHHPAIAMSKS